MWENTTSRTLSTCNIRLSCARSWRHCEINPAIILPYLPCRNWLCSVKCLYCSVTNQKWGPHSQKCYPFHCGFLDVAQTSFWVTLVWKLWLIGIELCVTSYFVDRVIISRRGWEIRWNPVCRVYVPTNSKRCKNEPNYFSDGQVLNLEPNLSLFHYTSSWNWLLWFRVERWSLSCFARF